MYSHQQMEKVVAERVNDWNEQLYHRYLLSQIPYQPPRWRRVLGQGMAAVGGWIMKLGQRVAQGAYSVTGMAQGELSSESE